ncbi:MAG: hypothetical protein KF892_23755 [Rhizobacter sp.]|nr:hypothetical protein [Rhizobacter sp.]
MAQEFVDIKISAFDDQSSHRVDPRSAIVRMVLELSSSAPPEWSRYFNERWEQNFYMMKRRAHVSGRRLEIECVPEELESDHLPQLKKIISETNQAYRQYHAARQQQREAEEARKEADSAKMSEFKKKLSFD